MSVQTHQSRSRRPRFVAHARYKPFTAPAELGPEALASHMLAWLLGNMDWLMQCGGATQSRAVIALHRDLMVLAGKGGRGGSGPATAGPAEPQKLGEDALLKVLGEQQNQVKQLNRELGGLRSRCKRIGEQLGLCVKPEGERTTVGEQAYQQIQEDLWQIRHYERN